MTAAVLRPPQNAGLGRGLLFALAAHALLLVALSAGVSWRSTPTPAYEAELWSAVPQIAAPREEAPPPEPSPAPKPQPKVEPDRRAEEQAAQREADIAVARERKRKEQREEIERQKQAQAKLDTERALEAERTKAKEALAAKEAKELKDAEARREAQLRRIQGLAGAAGTQTATGTALQNSAPSAGYAGRIKARIRPLIIFTVEGNANPETEVRISLAPDGRIVGIKTTKPSGDADWDRAVQRAIDKAESVPRDLDGRVPGYIDLVMRPRE